MGKGGQDSCDITAGDLLQSRSFNERAHLYLSRLWAACGDIKGLPPSEMLKKQMEYLRDAPIPVASLLGERLIAVPVNNHGGSVRQSFEVEVHGIDSGEYHFSLNVKLENPDGELKPQDDLPEAYAAILSTALHHPEDIGETVSVYWEKACNREMIINCEVCGEAFSRHAEAIQHERDVHGLEGDTRPRIGEVSAEHLDRAEKTGY